MRSAIAAIEAYDVATPIHSRRSYGVNTYTYECSSLSIKGYYHRAAGELAERSPDIRTYHWFDEMGWGRVSAVLQTPNGFVEVRASCNNDNDSVYVVFTPGHFEKPDAKIVESHELPNGFLRCDWER